MDAEDALKRRAMYGCFFLMIKISIAVLGCSWGDVLAEQKFGRSVEKVANMSVEIDRVPLWQVPATAPERSGGTLANTREDKVVQILHQLQGSLLA
jgi:hypothetical protein